MTANVKCKNRLCENRYYCKRYVTQSNPENDEAIDLISECNIQNNYAEYKYWKKED